MASPNKELIGKKLNKNKLNTNIEIKLVLRKKNKYTIRNTMKTKKLIIYFTVEKSMPYEIEYI